MAAIVIPVALVAGWRPDLGDSDDPGRTTEIEDAPGDGRAADATTTGGESNGENDDGVPGDGADASTAGAATAAPSTTEPLRAPLVDDLQADAADDGQATLQLRLVDPLALSRAQSDVELELDLSSGQVCFTVSTVGIRAPYPAAIHQGVSGQDGPVVVDLGELPAQDLGCVTSEPSTLEKVVADPLSHYLSFDDPNLGSSLRSQLATRMASDGDPSLDPDGGGATVVISEDAVILTGVVPDYDTEQWFLGLFSGAILPDMELTNSLRIAPETPIPSGRIFLRDDVVFELGSADLSDPTPLAVRQLAAILTAQPDWTAKIVGHTDDSGDEDANQALSLRRAEAVRDALVSAGVVPTSLSVEGAGSSRPLADNDAPEGRAQNRRIELEIAPVIEP